MTSNAARYRSACKVLIVVLALGFAVHALLAARTKAPTFDEPLHTFSSWLIVNEGDFRVNPEHPPLWKYLAGIGLVGHPLTVDLLSPASREPFAHTERQWWWMADVLFRTPGNDGLALVQRARVPMALAALALAFVVARWAWAWGGPLAAVIATTLLAFDPNFLAHGALVTNDVAATLVIVAATYLTWRLGTQFTFPKAVAFVLLCAAGAGVKLTCLLLAPMLGLPLLWRAIEHPEWRPARNDAIDPPDAGPSMAGTTVRRIVAVFALGLVTVLAAWVVLWPLYQFRHLPTSLGLGFDDTSPRRLMAYYSIQSAADRAGTPLDDAAIKQRVPAFVPSTVTRIVYWLQDQHVFPQAWGFGLTYAKARSLARTSYLLGEHRLHGFSWYFPVAVATKTPIATLLLAAASLAVAIRLMGRIGREPRIRWMAICLIVPPTIYLAAAMTSQLNIGVRHILPIYPPLYVGIGVAASWLIARRGPMRWVVTATLLLVAVETTRVFPNYLGFFNLAAGGTRGGLRVLGDSNLDWGQDLDALAEWYHGWRRTNPSVPFALAYFGSVDPHAYGIDYDNVRPGYAFDVAPAGELPSRGVFAVSATYLQGYDPDTRAAMVDLRNRSPLAVIGGTIYVYDLDAR